MTTGSESWGKGSYRPEWTPEYIIADVRGSNSHQFTATAVEMSKRVLSLQAQLKEAKEICLALASVVEQRNEQVDQLRLDGQSDTNLVNFLQHVVDTDETEKSKHALHRLHSYFSFRANRTGISVRNLIDFERNVYNGVTKIPRDKKGRPTP